MMHRRRAVACARTGFSIYFIYMAQEYPAVLPYHSVASTDRSEHYFKNTIRPSCFPAGMPWSHPSASTRVAVPPKTRRCRSNIVDAQELLLMPTMAELLVQAARRRLPGSDPILADLAHRLGACLRRRGGQLSAKQAVADPDFSILLNTINASNR